METYCLGDWQGVDATGWSELKPLLAQTHTHAHMRTPTYTHTKRHSPSCLPPLGGYFSCFQSCRQWQGSDNSCLLWHLSGSRGGSHCGACIRRAFVRGNTHYSALKSPHTFFFFFLIDWRSQSFWSERRPRHLTPICLSLSPFFSIHGLQVITCIWLKWWICKYETNPYKKLYFLYTFYYTLQHLVILRVAIPVSYMYNATLELTLLISEFSIFTTAHSLSAVCFPQTQQCTR